MDDRKAHTWVKRALDASDLISSYVDQAADQVDYLTPKDALRIFMVVSAIKGKSPEDEAALVVLKKLLQERMVKVLS